MAIQAAQLMVAVGADTAAAELGLGRVSNILRAGGPGGFIAGGAIAATAAIAGIGIASVKMAGDWQAAMTQIVTGAGEATGPNGIGKISAGLLQMAVDTATPTKDLAQAMFFVDSAGYKAANGGLTVMRIAAEGAKVAHADLVATTDVLLTSLHDYGLAAGSSVPVMNSLIVAVKNGRLTMDMLNESLTKVLPVASALHVPLSNVEGALSTMANAGDRGAAAGTHLAMMLKMLANPTGAAAKEMRAMGIDSIKLAQTMQTSLPDALAMIQKAVGTHFVPGSVEYNRAIATIMGGSKSGIAGLELMGTNFKDLKGNTDAATAALAKTGNTVQDWGLVQDNFNFKIAKAREVVETFMIKLGTGLLPVVGKLVDAVTANVLPALQGFADFVTTNIGPALDGIGHIMSSTVAPILRGFGTIISSTILPALQKFWAAIAPNLLPALRSLGTFVMGTVLPAVQQFAQFIATTILPTLSQLANFILTQVIPAAEKLGTWFAKKVLPILEQVAAIIVQNVVPVMESIFTTIMTKVVPSLEKIWNIVAPKLIPVLQFLGWIFKNVIGPAISFTIGVFGQFIGKIADVIGWVSSILDKLGQFKDFVGGAFSTAINGITTVFSNVFNGLWGIVKAPLNAIIGGVNAIISALDSLHVTIPSWVPGIGGQNWGINIPQVPLLAHGGTITEAGDVVVGDRGPEMLRLPRGAQVAPLTPSALPAGMQQAYGTAAASTNGQPLHVDLYLDGMKIAQIVTKHQPAIIRNGTGSRSF